MNKTELPTELDARDVVSRYLKGKLFSLRRFPTGLCHYVYEVVPEGSAPIVLRMAHGGTRANLEGSVYWTDRLMPLGVPLPKILAVELDGRFPYTILEHIPGVDLGEIYPKLKSGVRKAIAESVSSIQIAAKGLPQASGYGFAFSYEDKRLQPTWHNVIHQLIVRAREWIVGNGICNPAHVDLVEECMGSLKDYLDRIEPTPFLHDTTTKNVLVSESKLLGVVDVDDLCFGDPLLVLALTNMALLSRGWDTDYVGYWANAWNLSDVQLKALKFYTAVFCVTFMGEIGQRFNRDVVSVNQDMVRRLEQIFESLMN